MRILIVEDDTETCSFITKGLSEDGHLVVNCGEGRDGLFHATGDEFDVIILDRMLPGLDGLSVLKAVRASGVTTPVLMLTAIAGIADRVEGLEAGADDYLVKAGGPESPRPSSGTAPGITAASPIGETSVIGVLSCTSSQAARADINGAIARNANAAFNLEVRILFNSFRARKCRDGSVHARAHRRGSLAQE